MHLEQHRRYDLSRDAVFVLEPAALFCGRIGGELFPVIVDLLLGLAIHHKGDGFVEFEQRAGTHQLKLLPQQLDRDNFNCAEGRVLQSGCIDYFRVLENRDVELCRFPGFLVEP
jgi:hypothetical protein